MSNGARVRAAWLLVLVVLIAACSNSSTGSGSGSAGGDRQGITDTEIRVGGLAAVNNPLGGTYADAFEGAQAYFDKVNAAGGVDGRTINMVAKRDEGGQSSRDLSQARALVEQDKVFAVLPVATISLGAAGYLAENKIPTFGWNINSEWGGPPNLFGQTGSYLCFDCPNAWLPYVALKAGFKKLGILTYSAPQSQDCAKGWRASVTKFGPRLGLEIVFEDTSLSFGFTPPELGPDLAKMKSSGVQFLVTCIDGAGSAKLGQALKDNGLNIKQYLPNGYDADLIAKNAAVLEGDYVTVAYFPIEADQKPQALQDYVDAMKARGKTPNENSLVGWINADQFVQGLKAAGKDVGRASLVEAINKMTNYTAGGILPGGVNWTFAHTAEDPDSCASVLQVRSGKLVPILGQPGKPHLCFDLANPDFAHPTYK